MTTCEPEIVWCLHNGCTSTCFVVVVLCVSVHSCHATCITVLILPSYPVSSFHHVPRVRRIFESDF